MVSLTIYQYISVRLPAEHLSLWSMRISNSKPLTMEWLNQLSNYANFRLKLFFFKPQLKKPSVIILAYYGIFQFCFSCHCSYSEKTSERAFTRNSPRDVTTPQGSPLLRLSFFRIFDQFSTLNVFLVLTIGPDPKTQLQVNNFFPKWEDFLVTLE